jgi:hypothetical protein
MAFISITREVGQHVSVEMSLNNIRDVAGSVDDVLQNLLEISDEGMRTDAGIAKTNSEISKLSTLVPVLQELIAAVEEEYRAEWEGRRTAPGKAA